MIHRFPRNSKNIFNYFINFVEKYKRRRCGLCISYGKNDKMIEIVSILSFFRRINKKAPGKNIARGKNPDQDGREVVRLRCTSLRTSR